MAFLHVVAAVVAVAALTAGAEEQSARKARTPGLLHLAHAGHSVGSYVGAGGGGGPHIVIVGRPAHITTHVASRDSLEELDKDLRQHYGPSSSLQGGHYVLPSAGTFRTYHGFHGYSPLAPGLGHPFGHSVTPSPHFAVTPASVAYAPPHNFIHGVTPTYAPAGNYAQSPTPANNYAHSATPASNNNNNAGQGVTPSSVSHHSATPVPLAHTLASPALPHGVLPGRLPLHPLHTGYHGLGYHQSPVFIPLQALGHQPHFQGHPLVLGRVRYPSHAEQDDDHSNSSEEGRHGYYDAEERIPSQYNREFDSGSGEKSRDSSGLDNGYKFGSDEGFARSAAQSFFRPSDDQGSYEESGSHERASGERTADSGTYQARALQGDDKVATSYQSVTLETHHQAQPLYLHRAHPQPSS